MTQEQIDTWLKSLVKIGQRKMKIEKIKNKLNTKK